LINLIEKIKYGNAEVALLKKENLILKLLLPNMIHENQEHIKVIGVQKNEYKKIIKMHMGMFFFVLNLLTNFGNYWVNVQRECL